MATARIGISTRSSRRIPHGESDKEERLDDDMACRLSGKEPATAHPEKARERAKTFRDQFEPYRRILKDLGSTSEWRVDGRKRRHSRLHGYRPATDE